MSDSNNDVYGAAERLGDVEVFEMDNQTRVLNLDLDDGHEVDREIEFILRQHNLLDNAGTAELRTVSRSGQGKHQYFLLQQDMALPLRIAMQAALGSDPKREILSLIRLILGSRVPAQVMFEVKSPTQSDAVREFLKR